MQYRLNKGSKLNPMQILSLGFLAIILVGGILLSLPISSSTGEYTSFIDAVFTSTSAVCVTGLITVDTGTHWNLFGKTVIMILIEIGGLGFMSFTTLIAILLGKKITLRERLILQNAMNTFNIQGVVKMVKYILLFTTSIQLIGALIFCTQLIPEYGLGKGLFYSIFHSISAFCNAGFDLMGVVSGPFSSLTYYVNNFTITITVSLLIILGGIGFPVILDLIRNKKLSKLNIHSKVVLFTTFVLIGFGMLFILVLEYNNPKTLGQLGFGGKILASLFQSVTLRTAGFNTIDLAAMRENSIFFMIILMFIGASPASTGGGVKTTTIATLILTVKSFILEKQDIEVCERRISETTVKKSLGIFLIGVALFLMGTLIISITDPDFSLLEVGFEVVSAIATVGLSIGGSPNLSILGKIFIMLFMFMGRVGSLTIFMALASRGVKKNPLIRYPEGKIIVG